MTILDEVRSPALPPAAPDTSADSAPGSSASGTGSRARVPLVDRLANGLLARTSRRGFLSTSAVVGAALVTNTKAYALTPTSAYQAVCGPSAECSAGYTAFCCTINAGKNACPPGSLAGGWWKADGSGFCCGGARYYVDCHYTCSCGCAGTNICSDTCTPARCTCATGDCDKRRTNCNRFRYGQCNTHVSCVGPVLCRVVTCTPPWKQFDCSTSSATDNATGSHSASCLPGAGCLPTIDQWWWDQGGPASPAGGYVDGAVSNTSVGGGTKRNFTNAFVYHTAATGIVLVRSPFREAYAAAGFEGGALGLPSSGDVAGPHGGFLQQFAGGVIYWQPNNTPAVAVTGENLARYQRLGGPANLGYPWEMGEAVPGGIRDSLQDSRVYTRTGGQSYVVPKVLVQPYRDRGETGGVLGWPTSDLHPIDFKHFPNTRAGAAQRMEMTFEHGRMIVSGGVVTVELG